MHRSRMSALLIDAPTDQADASAAFWTAALGVEGSRRPGEPQFTSLAGGVPGLAVAVQSVAAEARFHVDVETDDVAAETARLRALGAVEVGRWLECHTLRVPGGHLLCVLPVHSDAQEFAAAAHTWP